jgi:diacylglycerol O-acyltransferase
LPRRAIGHGLALNITLISYLDQLDFGLIACRETVPDIEKLTGYIVEEFEELKHAVEQRHAKAAPPGEKRGTKREQKVAVGT